MFKVTIGREATMHGIKIGEEMRVNTWAAFAGSDTQAVVDGDFILLADVLQSGLKTMRAGSINIAVIHQNMNQDNPHYLLQIN